MSFPRPVSGALPLVAIVDDGKSIRNATQDLLKAAGFSTAASDLLGSILSATKSGLNRDASLTLSGSDGPTLTPTRL